MENRFGLRDFVLTVLLLAILVTIWLAMKQSDRHLQTLLGIQNSLKSQSEDIANIRNQLASGAITAPSAVAGASAPAVPEGTLTGRDPFQYIKEAKKKPGYATGDYYVDVFSEIGRAHV